MPWGQRKSARVAQKFVGAMVGWKTVHKVLAVVQKRVAVRKGLSRNAVRELHF